jgi:antitoxin component of MazEF toxin-antitoxin module
MLNATVEEINGNLVVTLPATLIQRLNLKSGSQVAICETEAETAIAAAIRNSYRLSDMLAASDPKAFERTEEDLVFLNSPPVGRELI